MVALALAQVPATVTAGAGDDDVLAMALADYDAANLAEDAGYPSTARLYQEAYDALLPLAEAGLPEAQSRIGRMLVGGLGRNKDPAAGFQWHMRAALQGNVWSSATLGYLYAKGIGVDADEDKAICWYTYAAEQGDANAQHNLSLILPFYRFTESNRWAERSAQQGYIPALSLQGRLRYRSPFEKDKVEPLLYLLLAERAGDGKAAEQLSVVRQSNSSSVRSALTDAELMASTWTPTVELPQTPPPPVPSGCRP